MRFNLDLQVMNPGLQYLPINYQYEVSSWIYNTINSSNPDFARWLHEQGYLDKNKKFKLFTFSRFSVQNYKVEKDRLILYEKQLSLIISFYPLAAIESFIKGIFMNQVFSIGDKKTKVELRVNSVEKTTTPEFQTSNIFTCLSPIHLKYENQKNKPAQFLHPGHGQYEKLFFLNLVHKYKAFYDIDPPRRECKLRILSEPKPVLVAIKANTPAETKIRGYLYRFGLTAPLELTRLGYFAGFGMQNSQGFGCCEVEMKKE